MEGGPPGPDLSPVTVLLDTGDIYSKKKIQSNMPKTEATNTD